MARLDNPHYEAAWRIARRLHALGHAAYFAGGCVRDMLLGVAPKDFDVATDATPDLVQAAFPRTEAVGAHFGVVLVIDKVERADGEAERIATEVATFRHDGAYSDGRRPDEVRFSGDPREDVLRRDFSINGLLLDALRFDAGDQLADCVLDYVGGQSDLAAKLVRAIGDPKLRFAEDKLRMLRAVRFAARLEFTIEPRTMHAIRAQAAEITAVSAERVRYELTRILTEGHARRGFELLEETGLLAQVLPEVARMKGVQQPPQFHPEGDVWTHTMMLLEHLEPLPGLKPGSSGDGNSGLKPTSPSEELSDGALKPASRNGVSPTLAWGMLLHDVGKPATFTPPDPTKPGDRIRFNGHVEVGVAVARTILNRLRFSNEDAAQILALVKHHMQFGDVMKMKQSTLKRFLRLPKFAEHLALHRADAASAHGDLSLYEFAKRKFEELGEEQIRPPLLLTGEDLIAAGYKPGPGFRQMLTLAEDAQLEGTITTREEALELVRRQTS
jgi:poly(A) polymerase